MGKPAWESPGATHPSELYLIVGILIEEIDWCVAITVEVAYSTMLLLDPKGYIPPGLLSTRGRPGRLWISVASRLDKSRQLRTFVCDENRNQFGPVGAARIGGDEVYRARRFKERLTDIE